MNRKLRCLLLDDELLGLTYLKRMCEQISGLEVVKAFNDPETFLLAVPKLEFDLCILDIEMPRINGLQIANLLQDKLIIFTTAYKEYASEAFELDAVDYVPKPVQRNRLEMAVQKAIKRGELHQLSKGFVQLNTDKGKALLFFDQLALIRTSEVDSRDKIAHLKDGTRMCLKNISFQKLLMVLPQHFFCRINKQEIIALSVVKVFTYDEIVTNFLSDLGKEAVLTLGDSYRKDFLEKVRL